MFLFFFLCILFVLWGAVVSQATCSWFVWPTSSRWERTRPCPSPPLSASRTSSPLLPCVDLLFVLLASASLGIGGSA